MEPLRSLHMLFFLDYDDGQGGRFMNSPGLLPMIGYVRHFGFKVDFIVTEAEIIDALENPDVDVVGISSMERMLTSSVRLARKVRELRPDVVLMLGGSAIEPFAVQLTAHLFDIVVLGESEHILPAILNALSVSRGFRRHGEITSHEKVFVDGDVKQTSQSFGPGALTNEDIIQLFKASFRRSLGCHGSFEIRIGNVYIKDPCRDVVWMLCEPDESRSGSDDRQVVATGGIYEAGSAPLADEIGELCIVPWDIVEKEGWKHFEFYTQRGCRWGRCRFCSITERKIRSLSPTKVVDVIAEAVNHGIELVSFADDLFVQHRNWNQELLEGLSERQLPVAFRAQTMATRTVWPILKLMSQAGFTELAFGVETLNPIRAEFMAKSFSGQKYVNKAKETIRRTAEVGIYPVVYMIMVDPNSTLLSIAEELEDTVRFCAEVYDCVEIVPKFSYSLVMLPVACTPITSQFEYSTETISLGSAMLELPTEFRTSPPVTCYLSRIAKLTDNLPHRRENLMAFNVYLESILEIAEEYSDPNLPIIRQRVGNGLRVLRDLIRKLDSDIEQVVQLVHGHITGSHPNRSFAKYMDFRRMGGYIPGIERFSQLLHKELQQGDMTT
ncbi:MAG: radical SAM protein [Ketobacter sp.]|nr:radical SAM protein [Ketobacter sp.]